MEYFLFTSHMFQNKALKYLIRDNLYEGDSKPVGRYYFNWTTKGVRRYPKSQS